MRRDYLLPAIAAIVLVASGGATAQSQACAIPADYQRLLNGLYEAAGRADHAAWRHTVNTLEQRTVGPRVRCSDRTQQIPFALELAYGPSNARSLSAAVGYLEVATFGQSNPSAAQFILDPTPADVEARAEMARALVLTELANVLGGPLPVTIPGVTNAWTDPGPIDEALVRTRARERLQRGLAAARRARGATALDALAGGAPDWAARASSQDAVLIALLHCSGAVEAPGITATNAARLMKEIAARAPGSSAHALLTCAARHEARSGAVAEAASTCAQIPAAAVVSERRRCERHVLDGHARAGDWREASALARQMVGGLDPSLLRNLASTAVKLSRYEVADVARTGAYAESQLGGWTRVLAFLDVRTAMSLQNWPRFEAAHAALAQGGATSNDGTLIAIVDSQHGCAAIAVDAAGGGQAAPIADEVCAPVGPRSMERLKARWDAYVRDTRNPWNESDIAWALGNPIAAVAGTRSGGATLLYSDWAGSLPIMAQPALVDRFEAVSGATYALSGRESSGLGVRSVRMLASTDLRYARLESQLIAHSLPGLVEAFSTYDGSSFPEGFRGASIWHFATHAVSAGEGGEQSQILLPGRTNIGFSELRFGLRRLTRDQIPNLVVLSSCDSARGDYQALTPSLANVFLDRGARWVVASSWQVDDLATALLMAKFYEGIGSGEAPDRALGAAQTWLSKASFDQVEQVIARASLSLSADQQRDLDNLGETPFADPIYWAAFRAYAR